MNRLLNRGFNFSILPKKIDLTQVFVDFKRYERAAIWTEFHYGKDKETEKDKPIFRKDMTNLPTNYTVPEGLKTFLSSVKSELSDPKNRNTEKCNIPQDELEALKMLAKLQREKKIVIKACDKGAGIIILNYTDYMKACYKHLVSKQSENQPYYTQVHELEVESSKAKIDSLLKEALENNTISKDEYIGMAAADKEPGRFYCNFKVHKQHKHNETPPERPIISGSGSITEGIATFVNHHIKDIATSHSTYLQDTPDFLRIIEHINGGPKLNSNVMIVTMDATLEGILHSSMF